MIDDKTAAEIRALPKKERYRLYSNAMAHAAGFNSPEDMIAWQNKTISRLEAMSRNKIETLIDSDESH